ncbi:hypothetical protein DOTSEDRAFT_71755 [Dothistroma septosporum NZE10]|uniref:Uncharacterized protein n=1 Tax=Dothistroma septosporum (strain NZE10 / CBS 128990) TaxID=675120 RepID=N1PNU1_DOTSN|nr:hypothetical protein DOTSEDRAFT_71755 [Dothistroma septosporum NZE10]
MVEHRAPSSMPPISTAAGIRQGKLVNTWSADGERLRDSLPLNVRTTLPLANACSSFAIAASALSLPGGGSCTNSSRRHNRQRRVQQNPRVTSQNGSSRILQSVVAKTRPKGRC